MVAVMNRIVDPRVANRIADELLPVHLRLEAWGRWSRERLRAWPERTILGRLIDEGPGAGHVTASPSLDMPEPVAETDRAVAHLGEIDRRVVRAYYAEWLPLEQLARRTRMSPRQFRSVLTRARWRILGYLSANNFVDVTKSG